MSGTGCGKSPTDSPRTLPEIGGRTTAQSDTVTIRRNRIALVPETVRLESEAGDSTLVFGTYNDPKYVTIHFELTPWSDINTLDSLAVFLRGFVMPGITGEGNYVALREEDGIVGTSMLTEHFKDEPWSTDISVYMPLVTHENTTSGTWETDLDVYIAKVRYRNPDGSYSGGCCVDVAHSDKIAATFTIPDFEGTFALQPVPTDESPAIVTNVAGGDILTVGIPEEPKYAIVRFNLPDGESGWRYSSNVDGPVHIGESRRAFEAIEDTLCISIENVPVGIGLHGDDSVQGVCVERSEWEDGIVAVPLITTYPTGKMRESRIRVKLYIPGSKARWHSPQFKDETTVYSSHPTRVDPASGSDRSIH